MGRISSRQGSALLHARSRAPRLAIALMSMVAIGLLAAAPAMASSVLMDGTTLRYNAALHEVNDLRIEASGADLLITDSVALAAGAGCVQQTTTSATCSGATFLRINVSDENDRVELLSSVDSVVFGRLGDDTLIGGPAKDQMQGQEGHDTINVRDGGADAVLCAAGDEDAVTSGVEDTVGIACRNDNGVVPTAVITDGPANATQDLRPSFSFTANEGDVSFLCSLEAAGTASPAEAACSSPYQATQDLGEGDYVFTVRAADDVMQGPTASRAFTVDRTSPQVIVTRLPPFDTSTPHFQLDAIDATTVTFECAIGADTAQACSSIFTTSPLADGEYVLHVTGTDAVGRKTTSDVPFRIEAVRGGGGVGPPTPPSVQPSKIIIDSLVLISGSAVKMSKRGIVAIRLHCAGIRLCKGRMKITTAEPVRRKSRKLVTLGSKKFSISANKKRKIKVRLSKSKRRLAKRLKRFKAKVVIHEIDQRGNPRISSRVFILRAR
jgi:hypothetical protein